MKFNKTILAAFAVVLPLSAGIGSALSYFTANVAATSERVEVEVVPHTDINEEVVDMVKQVVITNSGEVPVYIRLKAFAGTKYKLEISGVGTGEGTNSNWSPSGNTVIPGSDSDRYYEYGKWLAPGEKAEQINIKILDEEGYPIKAGTDLDAFNVVVTYERTPMAKYDSDGNMIYKDEGKTVPAPDWDYVERKEETFPGKSGIVVPEPKTEGGNE